MNPFYVWRCTKCNHNVAREKITTQEELAAALESVGACPQCGGDMLASING